MKFEEISGKISFFNRIHVKSPPTMRATIRKFAATRFRAQ
jgi:hypothetical protein